MQLQFSTEIAIMNFDSLFLFLAAPVVSLIYLLGEFLGWWDYLSGRDKAIEGFNRLSSTNGYPKSWIKKILDWHFYYFLLIHRMYYFSPYI